MKKLLSMLCVSLLVVAFFVGCSKNTANPKDPNKVQENETESSNTSDKGETTADQESNSEPVIKIDVKVASLKGPTSLGLLQMMNEADADTLANNYNFEIYQAADEIVTKVVKSEVDIALVPANVAAILYQKTSNQIQVVDINTLGVLSVVEHGESIQSVADLAGKTICMTGKGTVPEFAVSYLLSKNGLSMDDVNIEFKSEPAEVVAFLSTKEDAIGILPQPFVSSAMMQDGSLRIALDLTEEWNKVDTDSTLITGVTIVRKEFLNENEDAVKQFLSEHAVSVEYANNDVEDTANLAESFDLVKAAVAKAAIPNCNIVCISGDEMQNLLAGYLKTLYDANAESVGGTLPDEGFYYTGGNQE